MADNVNPFPTELATGAGINSDNFPVNDENQMLNSLLEDKNTPKEIKKKYWWIFAKDNILTFLDKDRKKNKLLAFDIVKLDNLMNMGYYEYDFETEKAFNELRLVFDTKLDRALGSDKSSQLNERIVQKSQFSENRNFMNDGNNSVKGKFFQRLVGR